MEREALSTIEKVSAVLETLAGIGRSASLQEIAEVLPFPKPTLRRLLLQLIGTGMVQQDVANRRYRLGHRLIVLAAAVLDSMEVRRVATPFLYALMAKTRESTYLAVLDHLNVVYVEVAEAERSLRVITKVGTRRPAYLTATGQTLLAFQPEEMRKRTLASLFRSVNDGADINPPKLAARLREVQGDGYAVVANIAMEITGIAAPIFDEENRCVAAIAIGVPTHRFKTQQATALIDEVTKTASDLCARLRSSERVLSVTAMVP